MTRLPVILTFALVLAPTAGRAQSLNGTAEWTVSRGTAVSDRSPYDNNSVWQRYTLDYQSFLVDPRLLKYNGSFSYRTNHLRFGPSEAGRDGRQNTLGYKLGGVAFPARPFPFHFEISRDTTGETGDYPASSAIRGGLIVPAGVPPSDYRTHTKSVTTGWQLNVPTLPRVEIGYRSASTRVTGGPYTAAQDDSALQLAVAKDSNRLHQSFRYDRSVFENLLSRAFDQRLSDLRYSLDYSVGKRSRLIANAGRRSSFSLFDLPSTLVDPGTPAYRAPSRGSVTSLYFTSGLSYDPSSRVSLSVTANADRQEGAPVATSALLATTAVRVDVVRGLSLDAGATLGQRGQVFLETPITVRTRSGQVGATYRTGVRWLEGMVAGTRGVGSNETPDGRTGDVDSWTAQALAALSFASLGLTAGYERQHGTDDLLDYGNFEGRRLHGSVQAQRGRLSSMGSWERFTVERGRGITLAETRQDTFTTTVTCALGRESRVALNGGGFSNRADIGVDRTLFLGGSLDVSPYPRVHLSTALRHEQTVATQTGLDQHGFRGHGRVEYRLRLFSFALEYRDETQRVLYRQSLEPLDFRGHQLMLRVARTFGMRLGA